MTPDRPGHKAVIRVGVVDDHPIVLEALRGLLDEAPDIVVVASAGSVPEAMVDSTEIDVVLLDLRLRSSLTVTQHVELFRSIGAAVIAYTSGESPALVREAARAGVEGMVLKSEPAAAVLAAVRQAACGGFELSQDVAAAIDSDQDRLKAVQLTPREREVLLRYASGQRAESVAQDLYISRQTVLVHIKNIRRKYRDGGRAAPTKVHLHQRAVEDGLLDNDC